MVRIQDWSDVAVPCCGDVEERSTRHRWSCMSEALTEYRRTEYGLFLSWMSAINTSTAITNFFKNILGCAPYGWSNREEPLAVQAQVIASMNFIQGLILGSWSQVQG